MTDTSSIHTGTQAARHPTKYRSPVATSGMMSPQSDVILICSGQEFSCNRSLLSEASPVLHAMFGAGFEEAKSGRAHLETVEAEIMKDILEFISTKFIPERNTMYIHYWCRLLQASHLLQMNDLSHYCLRQMTSTMKLDYFLSPWTLANLYDYPGFANMICTVVAKKFDEAIKTEDFLALNIHQMKDIVKHPEFSVSSMDTMVSAIMEWVDFDSENRSTHLLELLDLADLSSLSKGYLNSLICHRQVKRSHRVRSRLYAAASGLRHSRSIGPQRSHHRRSAKLYCFGSKREKQVLATYDFDNHEWLSQDVPFEVIPGMSATFCGDRIYLAGGFLPDNPATISSKIHVYYPDSKYLTDTHLLSPAAHAGAGVLHGCLYLVNGVDEKEVPVTTVQQYDAIHDVCRRISNTNQGHVRPFVGVYSDFLHVIGSCDEHQKDLERYDSFICQWTTLTSIPGSIEWCHAALCRHELFVVRSVCDGVFQVYDLEDGRWREVVFGDHCPSRVWGLWSVYCRKEDVYNVIARDRSHVLQFFNVENETWKQESDPNGNLWYGPQTVVGT